ncbi:ATPase, T2SS/T4P/T4SS family, partial [Pseudomonas aeruginosa]|uniref:ATPase, T2SS/T4P/T4SS family n=1 Tax=Pseudomonas aeruginosa TaxID=287 RepID=UPI001369CF8C
AERGYEDSQIHQIELAVGRSIGLISIAGPTGSGKSTTLKTMMEFDPKRMLKKRYSVEDPVEYKIFGVSRISNQRGDHEEEGGSNEDFIGVLRDVLRADPNDVMVGEIRDRVTTQMMADFVLTGHKIYTTVHTA